MAGVEGGRGADVGEKMRGVAGKGVGSAGKKTAFYSCRFEQREHGLTLQQDHSGCWLENRLQ